MPATAPQAARKPDPPVTHPDPVGLPTPQQRPDAHVVIFDGDCRFCLGQVRRLHRWDRRQCLAFVSLHNPLVAERYPDLSHDQLMEQMYIVDRRGRRYGGAAAARFLSLRIPRMYLLAPLLHIPFTLPLWQWCYRRIAIRRYRLMGKTESCDNGSCEIHFK